MYLVSKILTLYDFSGYPNKFNYHILQNLWQAWRTQNEEGKAPALEGRTLRFSGPVNKQNKMYSSWPWQGAVGKGKPS